MTTDGNGAKSPNWFVRVLILALSAFIVWIIIDALKANELGRLTAEVVILVGVLVILVLSETFNHFSLGQLLTVSREAKKSREEVERLTDYNLKLISSVSNTNHLNIYNTTPDQKYTGSDDELGGLNANEVEHEDLADEDAKDSSIESMLPPRSRFRPDPKKLSGAAKGLIDKVDFFQSADGRKDGIIRDLQDFDLELEDATQVLIAHLAATQLIANFEKIHSAIFQSQVTLLKILRDDARPLPEIKSFFSDQKRDHPSNYADWDVYRYLNYLEATSLIVILTDFVGLTPLGRDYLVWLDRESREAPLKL